MNELYTLIVWSEPSKLFLSFSLSFKQTNVAVKLTTHNQMMSMAKSLTSFYPSHSQNTVLFKNEGHELLCLQNGRNY